MNTVGRPSSLLIWSVAVSVLVLTARLAGLFVGASYAQETTNWALQAKGQGIGNLLAVVVLLVAAARHRAGSYRAGLIWLGTLLYLIYAFVVYAMAVHLGPLFLVYVAVLGLSAWAVLFHVGRLRADDVEFPDGVRPRLAAWTLIGTGALFGLLWLSELVPALVSGQVPASLQEAGLVVNPIHAMDLSVVLPGFIIAGIAALRSRRHGLFWLAPWLTFSVLMGASIVAAMLLITGAGSGDALPPMIMVSVVVAVSAVALWHFIGAVRRPRPRPGLPVVPSRALHASGTGT